ncbi:MAG: energy transducer TonB [Pseudomonadota bacterium]
MRVTWGNRGILALGLCLCASASFAQQDDQIQFPSDKASLECMLPAVAERGTPTYPSAAWANQIEATVDVKLTFSSPDGAPKVELLGKEEVSEFEQVVRQYVKRYRLPCFVPGQAPIETTQQFQFKYGDGRTVVYSNPNESARSSYAGCVAPARPTYPVAAANSGAGGTVVLEMAFTKRGVPSDVKVIYGARNHWLEAAAVHAAKQYLFNCDIPDGKPLIARQQFLFHLKGGKTFNFRDLSLVQLLRSADRSDFGKVRFDLTTMGCPFDLNLALYRPYASNKVGEFEKSDSTRKEFMDWLSQLTFEFPKGSEQYLIGKSVKLSVPCMILDFT